MKLWPDGIQLIVHVRANRRLGVESILVDRVAVPDLARVAVSPYPLFLSQEGVVVNRIRGSPAGVFFVTARGVVFELSDRV